MSTLEDKILGEKQQYYCSSSSESEGNDSDQEETDAKYTKDTTQYDAVACGKWDGTSSNTGPKGVIRV